ncbi:MAG: hypothetical protein ACLS5A_07395, partial [Pseudoruminococcus massiliensis]|uniref:hypothetical protein n=1 Tax=Pseudoruminococcus massiliensis TaxID=2086583 RepID=UPI003991530A
SLQFPKAEPLVALRRERNIFGRSPTFFTPKRQILSAHFLTSATLVNKGGLCPPLEGKEC